jgi:hypothetical protein
MPFLSTWPFELTSGGFAPPIVFTILAYLDPGTGSYALQILLATLFGGMFALKQSWVEVKDWLSTRFGRPSEPIDSSNDRRGTEVRPENFTRSRVDGQSPVKIS